MTDKNFLRRLISKPKLIQNLEFEQISAILSEVKKIFEQEHLMLEFTTKENKKDSYVFGDIHGNLESLLKIVKLIEKNNPQKAVFLGDIVDRGRYQLECLVIILCMKILNPSQIFLLKGNHETLEMNQSYGFFYEFADKYKNNNFSEILKVYDVLPICSIFNNSILCLHGGIPEDIQILEKIRGLKPKDLNKEKYKSINEGIIQILWNDPKEGLDRFMRSYRGPGIKFFGRKAFDNFMDNYNLEYLIRAHECFPEGYVWFFNNRLLSIFSAANYRGDYSPNPATYAIIREKEIIPKEIHL
ncbi:MAG: hypothetical protein GF353_13325 [Candidatus Lokiarchaeota archaeon]|nr:hypothetical protein [Candidatus Lokiarchaeota archaeon]